MSDKIFVGRKVGCISKPPSFDPVSKVILMVDNDVVYMAGDDSGRAIEAVCPYATQEMADALLAKLGGYAYQPMTAGDALIDPAAELGDAVTVDGIYTILAQRRTAFDALMASEISAPGQKEIESEYKPQNQKLSYSYQLAITRSLITKNAEQIRLEVANDLEGLSASFTVELDRISNEIISAENAITSLELDLDGITGRVQDAEGNIGQLELTSTNLQGQITDINGSVTSLELAIGEIEASVNDVETGLSHTLRLASDGMTVTDQAGKTVTISNGNLNLSGAITWSDLSEGVQDDINDAWAMASDAQGVAGEASDTVSGWTYSGTSYMDGRKIMTGTVTASTLQGGEIELLNSKGNVVGSFFLASADTADYKMEIYADAMALIAEDGYVHIASGDIGNDSFIQARPGAIVVGGVFRPNNDDYVDLGTSSKRWMDIYAVNDVIQTSDRERKKDIEYGLSQYDALFDGLAACSYRTVNGHERKHWGFVAQDIETLLEELGIDTMDAAVFIKTPREDGSGYDYGLRYAEFIALIVDQVQKLKRRVSALEES